MTSLFLSLPPCTILLHLLLVLFFYASSVLPSTTSSRVMYISGYAVKEVPCHPPWSEQPLNPLVVSSEPMDEDPDPTFLSPLSISNSADCVISDLHGTYVRIHVCVCLSRNIRMLGIVSCSFLYTNTIMKIVRSIWCSQCLAFKLCRN